MTIRSRPARDDDWYDYGGDLDVAARAVDAVGGPLAAAVHTHTAAQLSDASTLGRNLLKAADAAAGRSLLGAGTSSLALGTTSVTAKAGDYAPTAAQISDASTVGRSVLTAASSAAARTALAAVAGGQGIDTIVKLTQSAYDSLSPKVATTLYVIEG